MNFEEAKSKVIKYLGISKKTEYEVKMKLKRLNVDENNIDKVITYLLELDYINDLDYVDSYIRQSVRMSKYSIYEISEKLKAKGIKSNILDNKLDILKASNYEEKIIEKIINSKSKNMDEEKVKQYLYRRGFKEI